jgi:hypothetical protein
LQPSRTFATAVNAPLSCKGIRFAPHLNVRHLPGRSLIVVLYKQPLPIYLVYFTAWEQNGALQTVPDVYGLDRRHTAVTNGQ